MTQESYKLYLDYSYGKIKRKLTSAEIEEIEACIFATNLLVPKKSLITALNGKDITKVTEYERKELASMFGVPLEIIDVQLFTIKELEKISNELEMTKLKKYEQKEITDPIMKVLLNTVTLIEKEVQDMHKRRKFLTVAQNIAMEYKKRIDNQTNEIFNLDNLFVIRIDITKKIASLEFDVMTYVRETNIGYNIDDDFNSLSLEIKRNM